MKWTIENMQLDDNLYLKMTFLTLGNFFSAESWLVSNNKVLSNWINMKCFVVGWCDF